MIQHKYFYVFMHVYKVYSKIVSKLGFYPKRDTKGMFNLQTNWLVRFSLSKRHSDHAMSLCALGYIAKAKIYF